MTGKNQKTTIYLDAAEYSRLKGLAYRRGCAPAMLVREAVAEYVTRHAPRSWPTSIASANAGPTDLASNANDYLAEFGESAPRARPKRRKKPARETPGTTRRVR